MAAILGISPGVRTTALVVVRDASILDVIVRDTKGQWERCRETIVNLIESTIEKYQVRTMVMKIVPPHQITDTLEDLYAAIQSIVRDTGILLSMYETETLRKLLAPGYPNAQTLFSLLADQFPELQVRYHKIQSSRNRKVFEAVACCMIA